MSDPAQLSSVIVNPRPGWETRIREARDGRGIIMVLSYTEPGGDDQSGWYLDWDDLDGMPFYFGPFTSEDLARETAKHYGGDVV